MPFVLTDAVDATIEGSVKSAGRTVGSVGRAHLDALRGGPEALSVSEHGVTLAVPPQARDAALATVNAMLRQQGTVTGWRDEIFAVVDPRTREPLARIERAATRFWGLLTLGAHANGYLADAGGRPTHLWIARRADTKTTDAGLWDNLVGGGVPAGQSVWQTLLREGFEEAGLTPALMQSARPGSVMRIERDIPAGLQLEDLHGHDLLLPADFVPGNRDGEVQFFECLPIADALALAASSEMTVDASLITLDFALRHGLLPPTDAARLQQSFSCRVGGERKA